MIDKKHFFMISTTLVIVKSGLCSTALQEGYRKDEDHKIVGDLTVCWKGAHSPDRLRFSAITVGSSLRSVIHT